MELKYFTGSMPLFPTTAELRHVVDLRHSSPPQFLRNVLPKLSQERLERHKLNTHWNLQNTSKEYKICLRISSNQNVEAITTHFPLTWHKPFDHTSVQNATRHLSVHPSIKHDIRQSSMYPSNIAQTIHDHINPGWYTISQHIILSKMTQNVPVDRTSLK